MSKQKKHEFGPHWSAPSPGFVADEGGYIPYSEWAKCGRCRHTFAVYPGGYWNQVMADDAGCSAAMGAEEEA